MLHIGQQFVGFIKECLVKIANIHAHAITSDWLVAMLERQPKERPQGLLVLNQQAEQAILHENAESQNESLDDLKQPGAVPSAAVPTSPPANPR